MAAGFLLRVLALLVSTTDAVRALPGLPPTAVLPGFPTAVAKCPRVPTMRMLDAGVEPVQFEPQGDPAQFAILALAVAVPFGYWWYITVPEARLALSKDKRIGGTGEYIQELAQSDEARPVERWFFSKWLKQAPRNRKGNARTTQEDKIFG